MGLALGPLRGLPSTQNVWGPACCFCLAHGCTLGKGTGAVSRQPSVREPGAESPTPLLPCRWPSRTSRKASSSWLLPALLQEGESASSGFGPPCRLQ